MIKQLASLGMALKPRTRKQPLNIDVVCNDPIMGQYYKDNLTTLGHHVCVVGSNLQLLEHCQNVRPDLVIAEVDLSQRNALAIAGEIWLEWTTPFIIVSDSDRLDDVAFAADVPLFGYLIKPVPPQSLAFAVAIAMNCFGTLKDLSDEVLQLKQALEDRKVIERAKGMAMKYAGLEEEDAFTRLRKIASHQNRKLVEVAQDIVAAGECFRQLEQCNVSKPSNDDHHRRPPRE